MFRNILIVFLALSISGNALVFSEELSWYAVINSGNRGKKLYMRGDIFSSGKDITKTFRIEAIDKDSLMLKDVNSKDVIILKPGEKIPLEDTNMVFESSVEASVLEH